MREILSILFLVSALLGLSGCSGDHEGMISELEEKHFARGQQLKREGRNQEALEAFLKVIDKRHDAPESELEAGLLYLEHITDPIEAIHHFRRYLQAKPNSPQSSMVRGLMDRARKDFARQLPGHFAQEDSNRDNLMEALTKSREENDILKRELAGTRRQAAQLRQRLASMLSEEERRELPSVARVSATTQPSAAPVRNSRRETPSSIRPQTYTVKSGDTLSHVSAKVYGTSARWMDIFQANRHLLDTPNSLKPGQELEIP